MFLLNNILIYNYDLKTIATCSYLRHL